jgi:uncharacterized protein DUF736
LLGKGHRLNLESLRPCSFWPDCHSYSTSLALKCRNSAVTFGQVRLLFRCGVDPLLLGVAGGCQLVGIVNDRKDAEDAPDFRIVTGAAEMGAAWRRTREGTEETYPSVKLDDPV